MPGQITMPDGAIKRQGDSLAPQGVVFRAHMSAAQTSIANNATVKVNYTAKEYHP